MAQKYSTGVPNTVKVKRKLDYSYILSLVENLDFITKYDTLQLTTKIANLRLYYNCDESELIPLLNR